MMSCLIVLCHFHKGIKQCIYFTYIETVKIRLAYLLKCTASLSFR